MTSATKFVAGHSDVTAGNLNPDPDPDPGPDPSPSLALTLTLTLTLIPTGILSVRGDELAERVYFLQNSEGGGLAPFDCWLCLRGLKTMALRMERQQANCVAMAKWLQTQPLVTKIHYPGLPSDPGYALQMKQAKGGGSLLSFETGSVAASQAILDETSLFKVTVSFGATNSLVSLPCFMSHASIPAEVRAAPSPRPHSPPHPTPPSPLAP